MTTWARPEHGSLYCAIVARGSSYVTACNGRFEAAGAVSEEPPASKRCGGCVRIVGEPASLNNGALGHLAEDGASE